MSISSLFKTRTSLKTINHIGSSCYLDRHRNRYLIHTLKSERFG